MSMAYAIEREKPDAVLHLGADALVLSPGPGKPSEAGILTDLIRAGAREKIPMLGVCLGHQALGLAAGAEVVVGPCIMHGKASEIVHDGSGLFSGVPNPMRVGRYHSLVVRSDVDEAHAKFTVTKAKSWPSAIRIARGWASSSIRNRS